MTQVTTILSRRRVSAHAWGDDIEFTPATVVATAPAAADMHLVTVDVGSNIAAGYSTGGQFLQMKVADSKPAFLAIATPPSGSDSGKLDFLIKNLPDSTAALIVGLSVGDEVPLPSNGLTCKRPRHASSCHASPHNRAGMQTSSRPPPWWNANKLPIRYTALHGISGRAIERGCRDPIMGRLQQQLARAQVAVSPVMGKGFPVDSVPADKVDTMLIFATGSGISPIAALIEDGALDATARRDVRLFYGTHDVDSMAFAERCAALLLTDMRNRTISIAWRSPSGAPPGCFPPPACLPQTS